MSFNAKLGYSDAVEIKKESDWKLLTYSYNQLRPMQCKFTHIVSIIFERKLYHVGFCRNCIIHCVMYL